MDRALRQAASVILSLLAAICVPGCWFSGPVSEMQRARSFAPLSGARVGGEPLEKFLRERTAILLSWGSATGAEGEIGLASAIDSRGYFLTAAHCVRGANTYLAYTDVGGTKIARVRVVAMPADHDGCDFALVSVRATLPYVFSWSDAEGSKAQRTAAAVGLRFARDDTGPTASGVPICVAGRVLSSRPMGSLAVQIRHSLPLRPGDSGGPLASADGTLLGLNTGSIVGNGGHAGLAIRPDPAWVAKAIAEDLRRQADLFPGGTVIDTQQSLKRDDR